MPKLKVFVSRTRDRHGKLRMRRTLVSAIAASCMLVAIPVISGAMSASAATGTVTIGADLPISGVFAFFGGYQKWGYNHAVQQINATGGVLVGGHKEKVKLVILDDASNSTTADANIATLISRYHVVGLLGSCTPPLVNANAIVAQRSGVPMVTGCDPIAAFESVMKWTWVWDIFFYDPSLAQLPFQTLKAYGAKTNHKIAILHDNGPDGVELGTQLWPKDAVAAGYKVVSNSQFPSTTTNFSAAVASAKASGADVVLIDTDTPQAISIRQQMASDHYTPKFVDIEKGAEPFQFSTALKGLANGVLVGGYWSPSLPYPGAAALAKLYVQQTGSTPSQHIADSYVAAQVLLQAINRAHSTSPAAVNSAIAKTNGEFVVGHVQFNASGPKRHASALPLVALQWQGNKTVQVFPLKSRQAKLLFPLP